MHDSGLLPASATFLRRSCLEAHDRFDSSLRLAYHYEYCCRLLARVVRPTIIGQWLAAHRENACARNAGCTLQLGLESLEAAQRYADRLPVPQRYELWANCDRRRRIYALAQAYAQVPPDQQADRP